jgi:hypothetical protein
MTMVVGMFESLVNAQHAVADLVTSGYARNSISVLVRGGHAHDEDDEEEHGALARAANSLSAGNLSVLAGGPLGAALRVGSDEPAEHAVVHTLTAAGLQPAAARFFADAICHGAILVAVHCADRYVRDARDILDTYTEPDEAPRLS